jgi:hypothetical protein
MVCRLVRCKIWLLQSAVPAITDTANAWFMRENNVQVAGLVQVSSVVFVMHCCSTFNT